MRILMMPIPGGEADTSGTSMLRLELFASAYYVFHDRGIEAVLTSPAGGSPSMASAGGGWERRRRSSAALCLGPPGPIWRRQPDTSAAVLIADFLVAAKPVVVIPSHLDLAPRGTAEGLLVTRDSAGTPLLAAFALVGALDGRVQHSERTPT